MIFRSYQQRAEQIYDLNHFKNEHIDFFNKTTFYQLKDATSAVLAHEKPTSLAELFSDELKFTIDTLKYWFLRIVKPKFFEIDSARKQKFRKDNPLDKDSLCCLCDFPLAVDGEKGWFVRFCCRVRIFVRTKHLLVQRPETNEN